MNNLGGIDFVATLDFLAKSLAVVLSAIGLVVAINQLTLPSILRNREKWLRTALDGESNEHRRALLRTMLDRVTARLIAGLVFPRRFYVEAAFWLVLAPAQVLVWTRTNLNWWGVAIAVLAAVVALSNPIRRAIRLLAERARFIYDYLEASKEIRPPRTSTLAQMEGGTRREFVFGNLLALSINLIAAGAAVALLDLLVAGLITAAVGVVGVGIILGRIRSYVASRATIDGPWPMDHGPNSE